MPEKKCGTCRHWKAIDYSVTAGRDRHTDFRVCDRVLHDAEYESSGNACPSDTESVFDELAVTIDGSGYTAELRTKADFGCVLWEARADVTEQT